MFRYMLQKKYAVWNRMTRDALDRVDKWMKREEVYQLWSTTLDSITTCYEAEWRWAGVPDVVIKKFNDWHSSHTSSLARYIFNSTMNSMDWDAFSQTASVLSYFHVLSEMIDHDAERTLTTLNGELTGKKFGSLTLE
jgi:hypothetical protein